MSNDSSARRMHQQNPLMAPFAPQKTPQTQRNYGFVNENKRYNRLVARACKRCWERKVKCSGVITNTWPCTECERLDLRCVCPKTETPSTTVPNPNPNADADAAYTKQLQGEIKSLKEQLEAAEMRNDHLTHLLESSGIGDWVPGDTIWG